MSKKFLIFIPIVIVIGIVVYFTVFQPDEVLTPSINSFEECVSADYPVMESYPRQCKTPDGRSFTEDIGNELEKIDLIRVNNPRPNQIIQSPILIKGEARGYWFFEATFPIKLINENGEVIVQHYAQAKDDWMTEDFVSFEVELNFEIINTQKGTLILEKSNPSDLPENYDKLRIPVILEKAEKLLQTIKLYYYNPDLDKDETDNVLCSKKGLVAVERKIPVTKTLIQDTIKLLLLGELTNKEKDQGITTEYPLTGFSLKGASLKEGSLMLEFNDPNNKTIGGSCRIGILWFQIEATAKQFPQIQEVKFMSEDLFQP
ncbi:hypothetical protein KKA23_02770 [Patescibacteria group bacterium]|nr:hypothetical protein [Patescibacteria group bacterium]